MSRPICPTTMSSLPERSPHLDYLLLRDYLRSHPDAAERYGGAEAAGREPHYR